MPFNFVHLKKRKKRRDLLVVGGGEHILFGQSRLTLLTGGDK